jgi:hypothetical protein
MKQAAQAADARARERERERERQVEEREGASEPVGRKRMGKREVKRLLKNAHIKKK